MKKEMMNRVQGPPGAVESNMGNSPESFQGHSVGANPHWLDSRKADQTSQTNPQDVKLG
jgi:hypothetical protein